jgi:hypothetical protein
MAFTPGITGTNQVPTGSMVQFFSLAAGENPPTTLFIRNRSTAAGNLSVRIPALHGASGFATLLPGDGLPFRVNDGGITEAYGSGATAIVDWFPVAATRR